MSGVITPQPKKASTAEYALLGLQGYQTFKDAGVGGKNAAPPPTPEVTPESAQAAMDRRINVWRMTPGG